MTKTETLLRELIALPSVNPAFLPDGHVCAGESRVAEFLAERARRAGLEVDLEKILPGRSNLLVCLTPRTKSRRRILLAPHLDTVGWAEEPGQLLSPRVNKGRMYGRGACDTKGSVAIMFAALLEIAETAPPGETEIVFAGLIDEECQQRGSRALASSRFKADLAIVGEPTGLQVVTAHKGALWLELTTHGREAHGARPELGRNAVHEMAQIVHFLETDYAKRLRKSRHPLLGYPTINVGSIRGGRQPNIVPAECVSTIDRRMIPGETDPQVTRDLQRLLRNKGLRPRMRQLQKAPCLPLETSPKLPLVRAFFKHAGQTKPVGVDYFSDAGVLADGGIPSVLFGPGNIAQAHTPDEWIEMKQLERGKNILVAFLRSLG